MKKNGEFLGGRIGSGDCSKCCEFKFITVKFGEERLCKGCLDIISDEIGEKVAGGLGVVELPEAQATNETMAQRVMKTVDELKTDVIPAQPIDSSVPIKNMAQFSSAELSEMGAGAIPAEGGVASQCKNLPPSTATGGWR